MATETELAERIARARWEEGNKTRRGWHQHPLRMAMIANAALYVRATKGAGLAIVEAEDGR